MHWCVLVAVFVHFAWVANLLSGKPQHLASLVSCGTWTRSFILPKHAACWKLGILMLYADMQWTYFGFDVVCWNIDAIIHAQWIYFWIRSLEKTLAVMLCTEKKIKWSCLVVPTIDFSSGAVCKHICNVVDSSFILLWCCFCPVAGLLRWFWDGHPLVADVSMALANQI